MGTKPGKTKITRRNKREEQALSRLKIIPMFLAGLEPATFRVLGGRDNHYTTETQVVQLVEVRPVSPDKSHPHIALALAGRTRMQRNAFFMIRKSVAALDDTSPRRHISQDYFPYPERKGKTGLRTQVCA